MKTQTKHRKIFVLLICIVLAILLSGYTVVASVRVITDNRLKSGGDVFWTEGVEDFNIFEDLRPPLVGEAIIKPGVEGTYSFVVENRGGAPMTVYFRLFDENAYEIPMEYRLKTGDQYLMGNESTWEDSAHLDKYEVKDTLQKNTRREYKLDWSWADNRGAESDARDTQLGNLAASGEDVSYTLHMSLRAETEIEEPEKPEDPDEPTNPEKPEEPDKPTEPEKPEEPDKPTDPEEPEKPTDPENPDEPTDSDKPTEPDEPIDPENPDEPTNPEKPEDPSNPENPENLEDQNGTGESTGSDSTNDRGTVNRPSWQSDDRGTANRPLSWQSEDRVASGDTDGAGEREESNPHILENKDSENDSTGGEVQQVVVDESEGEWTIKPWVYTGLAIAAAGSFLLILLWKKRKSEEDETK